MRMFKKWSKSEISLRTAVMKIFKFHKSLTKPQTSRNPSNQQNNTLEYHFETCNSLTSQNWNWWKSYQNLKFRSGPRSWEFSIFDKTFTQPQTSRNPSNQQKNTLEYHFETCNSLTSQNLKWSQSEISLRTAVMRIFNFWQNFDTTSNFQKSFKSTKEHFRIPFWDLEFTHKW